MNFHKLGGLVILIEEIKSFQMQDNIDARIGFQYQISVYFKDGKSNTVYFDNKEARDTSFEELANRLAKSN